MRGAKLAVPIATLWLTACGSRRPGVESTITPLPSVTAARPVTVARPAPAPAADATATPCADETGPAHTWSCPMHPRVQSEHEGACPVCGMSLVEDPWSAPPDVAAAPAHAHLTASGLSTCVVRPGHGQVHPTASDRVAVRYAGWTTDGTMFDSSRGRSEMIFPLGGLIPGWIEGVGLMVEGEIRRLWIPESLAYAGRPGRPQGMLVFDVELVRIVP